jgi:hypothetical protein
MQGSRWEAATNRAAMITGLSISFGEPNVHQGVKQLERIVTTLRK